MSISQHPTRQVDGTGGDGAEGAQHDQPQAAGPVWTPPTPPLPRATHPAQPVPAAQDAAGAKAGAGGAESDPRAPKAPDARPGVGAPLSDHKVFAQRRGWEFFDLDAQSALIGEDVREVLRAAPARRFEAVPVSSAVRRVTVAVPDPGDLVKGAALRQLVPGKTVTLVYADPAAIRRHIDRFYSAAAEASAIGEVERASVRSQVTSALAVGGNVGRVSGGESANVQILRLIIEQALSEKASDIHIEPTEKNLEVRYRVDGKLRLVGQYESAAEEGLSTLIKVQAGMRSDNFLKPDSGVLRWSLPATGLTIDIRVETSPTAWGNSTVMRLQSEIWRELSTLGFSPHNERRFRAAIAQPYGIILATGPTGSGKSTTLYSALREKIDPERKILTLENPVEYKIGNGVSQMSVSDERGLTFAGGLRSILRQDPDIVLVGEIRDEETAETAVDAAMTGHLVLSTLHTNDAPGVVPRLVRMNIEPFLVASSLLCVVGQRLVRRLCKHCKVAVAPRVDAIVGLGFVPPEELPEVMFEANPAGCLECVHGFSGRVPIHEVMLSAPDLTQAIADNAPLVKVEKAAKEAGMTTLRDDGLYKALEGITSLQEINTSTRQQLV